MRLSGTTAYNVSAYVTNTSSEFVDAGSFFPQVAYCGNTTNSRLQRNLPSPNGSSTTDAIEDVVGLVLLENT